MWHLMNGQNQVWLFVFMQERCDSFNTLVANLVGPQAKRCQCVVPLQSTISAFALMYSEVGWGVARRPYHFQESQQV
jgi:hypothetical protein